MNLEANVDIRVSFGVCLMNEHDLCRSFFFSIVCERAGMKALDLSVVNNEL